LTGGFLIFFGKFYDFLKYCIIFVLFKALDRMTYSQSDIDVIYKGLLNDLYNHGRRFTNDGGLVMDSIHDLFENLLLRKDLSDIRNIKVYLLHSLKNRILKEVALKSYECNHETSNIEHHDSSFEEFFIEKEEKDLFKARLIKAFNSLSAFQKEIIRLFFIEMRSYNEISQMMNIGYHQVKNTLHRALTKLRRELC